MSSGFEQPVQLRERDNHDSPLAHAITDAIGDRWIVDLNELRRLKPLAADSSFQESFLQPSAKPR